MVGQPREGPRSGGMYQFEGVVSTQTFLAYVDPGRAGGGRQCASAANSRSVLGARNKERRNGLVPTTSKQPDRVMRRGFGRIPAV